MGLCNRARYALAATLLAAAVTSTPASAQEIDFSGGWVPIFHEDGPERIPGPELGDYAGLPINDAARLRADSYDADRISAVTEYQCRPHAADYNLRGLSNMRITAEIDPLTQRIVAFHTRMGFHDAERTIYLDGRPHPPAGAPHTWGGSPTPPGTLPTTEYFQPTMDFYANGEPIILYHG